MKVKKAVFGLFVSDAVVNAKMSNRRRVIFDEEEDRGLVWKLPSLQLKELGKLDPAFVLGAGCGLGLIGGAGFGPGLPALELAFGLGAGCGVGLGFGYGMGRGIAHDGHRT